MNRAPSYPRPDRSDQVRNAPESVSLHRYCGPRPIGSLPKGGITLCHVRKQHVKTAILEIVGKKIARVVVKEADRSPKSQVFLVFTDGTYYELYCCDSDIRGAGGLQTGGLYEAKRYMGNTCRVVLEG